MKVLLVPAVLALVLSGLASWWIAGRLVAPAPALIGPAPPDLGAQDVLIAVPGQPGVHGWWISAAAGQPAVLLLHGIRSNRLVMLDRARALMARGYAVLLIDLPAHGGSFGARITLGWREAEAVAAARDWMRRQQPQARLGVIAVSLGGASLLLGGMPCGFDAVVLESVYPDIHRAIYNRLAIRFGSAARWLTPLLELQLKPRLGIGPAMLRPLDHIAQLGAPLLLLGGAEDRHTRPAETQQMFDQAALPKQLWIVPGAAHESFFLKEPALYAQHVFGFLQQYLQPR